MENPFRKIFKDNRPLNAVHEVGRDPLRVPIDTPLGETIKVALELAEAKKMLMTVLPQPNRESFIDISEICEVSLIEEASDS